MKFASALILAASATFASANTVRATASLLSKARRLEDANQEGEQQQEEGDAYTFLAGYSAKLISCVAGEQYTAADGQVEYSSVIFRLCPADSCDSDSAKGCKKGYGDYVIGINSYVEAWLEEMRDNLSQDDKMNMNELSECREFGQAADDGSVYYVGPACSGTSAVKMGFFAEETCLTTPDVSFEDVAGWSLPYSGGLVGGDCHACAQTNDQGESEISDLCMNTYMYSGHCEAKMEKNSQYSSNDESACEYISSIAPKSKTGGGAGAAIGWVIFALVIVAAAGFGYTKWWTAKKQSQTEGI
jgi:hypothetical protein